MVSEKREAPRIEILSDGTIAGGMIANTKDQRCQRDSSLRKAGYLNGDWLWT